MWNAPSLRIVRSRIVFRAHTFGNPGRTDSRFYCVAVRNNSNNNNTHRHMRAPVKRPRTCANQRGFGVHLTHFLFVRRDPRRRQCGEHAMLNNRRCPRPRVRACVCVCVCDAARSAPIRRRAHGVMNKQCVCVCVLVALYFLLFLCYSAAFYMCSIYRVCLCLAHVGGVQS